MVTGQLLELQGSGGLCPDRNGKTVMSRKKWLCPDRNGKTVMSRKKFTIWHICTIKCTVGYW